MSTITNTPRLADKYKKEVVPALMKKFSYKTVMQAPSLTKICLNRGVNGAVTDKKLIEYAIEELQTSPARKQWQPCLKKISQTSNCVRTCRLVQELLYVV